MAEWRAAEARESAEGSAPHRKKGGENGRTRFHEHWEFDPIVAVMGIDEPSWGHTIEAERQFVSRRIVEAIDFSDADHLREVISCLQELARLGLTTPGFVLYLRAKLGLYNLFHQMGARVNCHKVYRKYV